MLESGVLGPDATVSEDADERRSSLGTEARVFHVSCILMRSVGVRGKSKRCGVTASAAPHICVQVRRCVSKMNLPRIHVHFWVSWEETGKQVRL